MGFEIIQQAVVFGKHPSGSNYRLTGTGLARVDDWTDLPLGVPRNKSARGLYIDGNNIPPLNKAIFLLKRRFEEFWRAKKGSNNFSCEKVRRIRCAP